MLVDRGRLVSASRRPAGAPGERVLIAAPTARLIGREPVMETVMIMADHGGRMRPEFIF